MIKRETDARAADGVYRLVSSAAGVGEEPPAVQRVKAPQDGSLRDYVALRVQERREVALVPRTGRTRRNRTVDRTSARPGSSRRW